LLFGLLDAASYLFSKVEASGHGTGKLPTDILDSLDFIVPDDRTSLRIIQFLDALNDKIAANHTEDGTLAALRDMLPPKLMSGEIRIKDTEKIAAAAQ
jgi:type I restriction enzyme S subunit